MKTLVRFCTTCIALFALHETAAPAKAVLILIDFNSSNGSTSGADTNGNYWTTITTVGTASNLIDSTNAATTVDLGLGFIALPAEGFAGAPANSGDTGATATTPFNQPFAYLDGLFTNDSASGITVALTDLLPNTLHTFQSYGRRNSNGANANIAFTVGTGSSVVATQGVVTTFSATSDASGQITFIYKDTTVGGGASALLNAMSISYVPEPTSFAMLACGAATILLFHRKRRS